jgi:prepilin-type processing-associated H-X9-DG protein
VYAADGWWTWFGSVNAAWLAAPKVLGVTVSAGMFPDAWHGTSIGWRHGRGRSANFLFRDGHVSDIRPRLSGFSDANGLRYETIDTSLLYTWLPGENPTRRYDAAYGAQASNPHQIVDYVGREPAWVVAKETGRGAKVVGGTDNNLHPFAYPEHLNAVWRTTNRAWYRLPADPLNRR